MKLVKRNSQSVIVVICNRLSELKSDLQGYQGKLQKSSVFLRDLQKWLEKLRHYDELDGTIQLKRLMNDVTTVANKVWQEMNLYKEQISILYKQIREEEKRLKQIYKVTVIRG